MMGIGVGVIAAVIVRESVALGPGVLAVIGARTAGYFGVAGVLVNVQNIPRIERILIGRIDNIPDISRGGGIGKAGVVIDNVVQ